MQVPARPGSGLPARQVACRPDRSPTFPKMHFVPPPDRKTLGFVATFGRTLSAIKISAPRLSGPPLIDVSKQEPGKSLRR